MNLFTIHVTAAERCNSTVQQYSCQCTCMIQKRQIPFCMLFLELTDVDHNEVIHINNPTCGTQLFKPLITHIRTYMVVITILDINIILLEQDQEISINA